MQSDLSNANASDDLCQGIDAVVHLAGIPAPDGAFADVLPANILATTNLIEAARKASDSSLVYTSGAQTIEGYPVDRQIVSGIAVAPANLYGSQNATGRHGAPSMQRNTACPVSRCALEPSNRQMTSHLKPNAI